MNQLLVLVLCAAVQITGVTSAPTLSKGLLKSLESGRTANVLLSMTHGSPTRALENLKFKTFPTRASKLTAVYTALKEEADVAQENVLQFLKNEKVVQLWVSNQIIVKEATHNLVLQLSTRSDISSIEEEIQIPPAEAFNFEHSTKDTKLVAPLDQEDAWGIDAIGAPLVWANGTTGQGIVVGTIDTGVRVTHEALRDNYKNDGYSWYEPDIYTTTPHDGSWHGTHTISIIVGTAERIGIAPGAKWMSCKWCEEDAGPMCTDHKLLECGQFMVCPTKFDGTEPNCSHAPHLISNSWAWGSSPWYDDVLNAWRAADIIPIFAIGNGGPDCSTTVYPGLKMTVISVGATTRENELSVFSSIGPNEEGERRPDISAPGSDIAAASSGGDNEYRTQSGTSMSAPHGAGLAALLLSRQPNLSFDELKSLLERGALPLKPRNANCGAIDDVTYPNNHAGAGIINSKSFQV